ISAYTLALKVSSFFFVLPMFIQFMGAVLLNHVERTQEAELHLSRILGLNAAISLLQFCFYLCFGTLLLRFFGDSNAYTYTLGLVLNVGVLLLNLTRPVSSYLMVKAPLREVFLSAHVPTLTFALFAYPLCTYLYGSMGTAWASLLSYGLLGALLVRFALKMKYKILRPRFDFSIVLQAVGLSERMK
ncbi:MAG: hypothetical protein KDD53_10435, partial [Bdellovibrionales bacterium]|nr:hypothetical protein [Bdellovibrionales bacterium]